MNRSQIENLYKVNGIKDFHLRNTEDLLKVHGINYRVIDGYNRLDDLNKLLYEKFIINIFNAWGLESRATLIPKGIYYVEEKAYLVKEYPDDEYFTEAGSMVKAIDKNGLKTVLRNRVNEHYKHLKTTEATSEFYLRFEYEHQARNEWLHVINENQWY